MNRNIHPVFDRYLQRDDKEQMLNQKGCAVWLTGLSGSGKTTIAQNVEQELAYRNIITHVLDGDNIRTGICSNLGFTDADRAENIRRAAEVSRLFVECGIVVIICVISPTAKMREHARAIIGSGDFVEVFVDAPLEECEARDVKGLYGKARSGNLKGFTGVHTPYERPEHPDVHLDTMQGTVESCVQQVLSFVLRRIQLS